MRKNSASDSDEDKTVHYELSRGGYVTSNDKVALTNYLVHLPSQNYVIMEIDVEEELNERRNGWDLDDVCDDAREFDDKTRK